MISEIQNILSRFSSKKVLVIGDFILDTYIRGQAKRISPEAPIPVVDIYSINNHPGGAANTALNLKLLSAEVCFCSVVGNDDAGQKGIALLKEAGISTEGIFIDEHKATQMKTRIMADAHAVVRCDAGDIEAPQEQAERQVISFVKKMWKICDAVLIADYEKGMLTGTVLNLLCRLKKKSPRFIAVDSKRLEMFKLLYPDLIKPNFEEAQKLLELNIRAGRPEQLKTYGPSLRAKTNASVIALTLDEDGALWFEQGIFKNHVAAPHIAFPQVSGAGDTFIAAALLALLSGATLAAAGEIACMAASIVVEKEDTAFCTSCELSLRFHAFQKLISADADFATLVKQYKLAGKKIIFTNGCFDILHSGHIHFLQHAKKLGDILIVGLNSDESVRRLKGKGRPVNSLSDRLEVLSAIGCVDHIIPFGIPENDTANEMIRSLKPDIFVKGEDYKFRKLAEAPVLKALGIPVYFLPFSTAHSTAGMIHRIQKHQYTEIKMKSL